MNKKISFLTVFFFAAVVFAAGVKEDVYKIGKPGSTSDKVLQLGTDRQIRSNETTGVLEFTNDNALWKKLGSGSGGGTGVNLLADDNADFEAGTPPTTWVSAGAATFVADSTTPLFGQQSGVWDASATGATLTSPLKVVEGGFLGRRCEVAFDYQWPSATAGDVQVKVFETGAIELLSIDLNPTDAGQTGIFFTTFPCPILLGNGLQVVFQSTADAAALELDNVFLGTGRNNVVGVAANTIAEASIGAPTTTDGIQLTFTDLTVGDLYEITYRGTLNVTDGALVSILAVHDGANIATAVFDSVTGNAISSFEKSALFTATATSLTINTSNFGTVNRTLTSVAARLEKRNDLKSTFVEANTFETSGEYWSLVLKGANPNLNGGASVSTLTPITDANLTMELSPGSKTADVPCSGGNPSTGLTCTVGDEQLGAAFTISTAGRYRACAQFEHRIDVNGPTGSMATGFRWVETPNNSDTTFTQVSTGNISHSITAASSLAGRIFSSRPVNFCGDFTFGTAGQKTIRLMFEQFAGGTTPNTSFLFADGATSVAERNFNLTIEKLDQQMPAPVFPAFTEALDAKLEVTEPSSSAKLCASHITNFGGVGSLVSEVGDCVASINKIGTGDYRINFTAGTFAAAPICTCSSIDNVSTICNVVSTDATNMRVRTSLQATSAGAWEDSSSTGEGYMTTCIGRK